MTQSKHAACGEGLRPTGNHKTIELRIPAGIENGTILEKDGVQLRICQKPDAFSNVKAGIYLWKGILV